MSISRATAWIGVLLLVGFSIGAIVELTRGGTPSRDTPTSSTSQTLHPSTAVDGWRFHRRVPDYVLTTADGKHLALSALHGKVVVLVPSLTLCHEICPLTTQALMRMREAISAARLLDRVALVEATVDPWRDSPARLRAYSQLTGSRLTQLTGGVALMRRFWDFFGIGFRRVPQGKPPDIDWWTGRGEKFDVEHVDGLFLIDQYGYERSFFPGTANVGGHIDAPLKRLLSRTGLENLTHPTESWTADQVLAQAGRLLGKPIPRAR